MLHTPLYDDHVRAQAKIIEFAGYAMPVHYAEGIKQEHLWVRAQAGLFDVSHMGQALIAGEHLDDYLMNITPSGFRTLAPYKAKYTVLTNDKGGIIDDFIATKLPDNRYFLVFNAACKDKDITWFKQHLPKQATFTPLNDRALLALQGPKAASVLGQIFNDTSIEHQAYMSLQKVLFQAEEIFISRLGYTGEDGFEMSVPASIARTLWQKLLTFEEVKPIGLGARDSLRLEVGYPLYGHDLDDTTSPVEANLNWIIRKQDQSFIGSERIIKELATKPSRLRVGIELLDKGIVREHTAIYNTHNQLIGEVTSGGFGPTLDGSIAQGYVQADSSAIGTDVTLMLRGRPLKARVAPLGRVRTSTKTSL